MVHEDDNLLFKKFMTYIIDTITGSGNDMKVMTHTPVSNSMLHLQRMYK